MAFPAFLSSHVFVCVCVWDHFHCIYFLNGTESHWFFYPISLSHSLSISSFFLHYKRDVIMLIFNICKLTLNFEVFPGQPKLLPLSLISSIWLSNIPTLYFPNLYRSVYRGFFWTYNAEKSLYKWCCVHNIYHIVA